MFPHINSLQDVVRKIVRQVLDWYEPRFRRITMSHDTSDNPAELVGRDGIICYRKEGGSCEELATGGDALWELTTDDTWATTTAHILTDYVEPTTPNAHSYECVVAGTTGGTEPIWPTTDELTVVDGTATWACKSVRAKLMTVNDIDLQGGVITTSDGSDWVAEVGVGYSFVLRKV